MSPHSHSPMMLYPAALTVLSLLSASLVSAEPSVLLGNTTLVGLDLPILNQEFFGGIPYAEAPVGSLRFEPPVPKTNLNTSTFDATHFGLPCLQPNISIQQSSEDCLTINVQRPSGLTPSSNLPVMAFIFGGGFVDGSASIYNGSALVESGIQRGTPIIYVVFNYRLGPLGFPQGSEAGNRGDVNIGLRDQLLALQWIQQNIGTFGGDSSQVTVFGESAGAISISIHYFSSEFADLARATILESGSAATTFVSPPSGGESDWKDFVTAVPECASAYAAQQSIPCLQKVTDSAIILEAFQNATAASSKAFPWAPVIDGVGGILPDYPSVLLSEGKFFNIPFIAGTNLDEGTDFVPSIGTNYTTAILEAILLATFSPAVISSTALLNATEGVLKLYPDIDALGSPFNTGNDTFGLPDGFKRAAAIIGDLAFQSQRRTFTQIAAAELEVDGWSYLFTDPQPPPSLGVAHGSEVKYVFGEVNELPSASAQNLSRVMMDYWISFATSLDPNDGLGTQRPLWSKYTAAEQDILRLNSTNTSMIPDDYRREKIQYIQDHALDFYT